MAHASLFFKNLRVEEEERRDRELRAKLLGGSKVLTRERSTDIARAGLERPPSQAPFYHVKQPAAQLAVGAEASTKTGHSNHSDETRAASTQKTLLAHIMSISFGPHTLRPMANAPG